MSSVLPTADIASAIAFVREFKARGAASMSIDEKRQMCEWIYAVDDRGDVGLLLDAIVATNQVCEIGAFALCILYTVDTEYAHSRVRSPWEIFRVDLARADDVSARFKSVIIALAVQFHADPARSLDLFQRIVLLDTGAYADDSPVCRMDVPLTGEVMRALRGDDSVHLGTCLFQLSKGALPREDTRAKLRWLLSDDSPMRVNWNVCAYSWNCLDLTHSPYEGELVDAMLRSRDLCVDVLIDWADSSYDTNRAHGRFERELNERFPEERGNVYSHIVNALTRGQYARALPSALVASVAAFLRTPSCHAHSRPEDDVMRRIVRISVDHPSNQAFHRQVVRATARVQLAVDAHVRAHASCAAVA